MQKSERNVFHAQVVISTYYETVNIQITSLERLGERDIKNIKEVSDECFRMKLNAAEVCKLGSESPVRLRTYRGFGRANDMQDKVRVIVSKRDSSELIESLKGNHKVQDSSPIVL